MDAKLIQPALSRTKASRALALNRLIIDDCAMLKELESRLPQVTIDGTNYWVAEADLLFDADQLRFYARRREAEQMARLAVELADMAGMAEAAVTAPRPDGLVVTTSGRKPVRWEPGRVLSYCVLRKKFGGNEAEAQEHYQMVVDAMALATNDWARACNVRFEHVQALDDSTVLLPEGVLFAVRELDAGGEFIASAFFPNDPVHRRRVLIDPSFYAPELPFDRAGVLRHELGHVLGFRHEHIRSGAPPDCPRESTADVFDLTAYDPNSVMHYFCGGVGDPGLRITDIDREGAQAIYGAPIGEDSATRLQAISQGLTHDVVLVR